MFIGIGD